MERTYLPFTFTVIHHHLRFTIYSLHFSSCIIITKNCHTHGSYALDMTVSFYIPYKSFMDFQQCLTYSHAVKLLALCFLPRIFSFSRVLVRASGKNILCLKIDYFHIRSFIFQQEYPPPFLI